MSDINAVVAGEVASPKYDTHLEEKMAHLLVKSDVFSTLDFDLYEQLNLLFPNADSINTASEVYEQTKTQFDEVDRDWRDSLRCFQSTSNTTSDTALDLVYQHIKELTAQVESIYNSAEQSETTALEMTKDVKQLDTAKKNLTETMTVLKRLQMLVTATSQLEISVQEKQHSETAQLLEATSQLLAQFDRFANVEQLESIRQEHEQFQRKLSDQLFREFTACFHAQGVLVQTKSNVQDICLIAQSLDKVFRDRLIQWYTKIQLQEYRNIFCGNEEVASLEGVPRRYTWLKRLLKTIEEEHGDLFPESWHVARGVAYEFAKVTRQDMQAVLEREAANDVAAMLKALQLTLEFEQQLNRKFMNQDKLREELVGETSEAPNDSSVIEFTGSISKAFEPFLGYYIESIDRSLSDLMQGYLSESIAVEEGSDTLALASSSDLVYFFKEAFGQCAKLSTGRPLVDLSKLAAKWLAIYANTVLKRKLPQNDRRLSGSGSGGRDARIIASYVVINTADYCQTTAEQLEEKFRDKVDTQYCDEIHLSEQREPLLNIIITAVKSIVREVEIACEPSFQRMLLLPWGTMSLREDDHSEYATELLHIIKGQAKILRKHLMNYRFYRSFCDQFAETFIQLLDLWIGRIKRLSSMGAKQLISDLAFLRTMLLDLPSLGGDASSQSKGPSMTYTRIVQEGINKIEASFKLIDLEANTALVESYVQQAPTPTMIGFQRVLELKGLSRVEQQPLLEYYRKQYSPQESPPTIATPPTSTSHPLSSSPLRDSVLSATSPIQITTSPNTSITAMSTSPSSRYNKFRRLVAGMSMKRDPTSDRSGDESGSGL
ncbi:Vps53-like protein [Syncephalis fuscata]|nr:Vps53-like protein [Syncephalis fuscata]